MKPGIALDSGEFVPADELGVGRTAPAQPAEGAANAVSEPVARVNDEGFIVEIGDLLLSPGQKLCLATPAQAPAPGWVPGQPITEEMHVAAVKVLHRASGLDGLPQRMLDAMIAAAPSSGKGE